MAHCQRYQGRWSQSLLCGRYKIIKINNINLFDLLNPALSGFTIYLYIRPLSSHTQSINFNNCIPTKDINLYQFDIDWYLCKLFHYQDGRTVIVTWLYVKWGVVTCRLQSQYSIWVAIQILLLKYIQDNLNQSDMFPKYGQATPSITQEPFTMPK